MCLYCLTKLLVLNSSDETGQIIIANTSSTITLTLFVTVLAYHLFIEIISKTTVWRNIAQKWTKVDGSMTVSDDVVRHENELNPQLRRLTALHENSLCLH